MNREFPDKCETLWLDSHLATLQGDDPYGTIRNGALAVSNGEITWVGPVSALPENIEKRARTIHRLGGMWMTPGLIDCHTHLVYAGNRAHEFELRLTGATYEEIANAGGGIMNTVNAVRAASEDILYEQSVPRVKALMAEGVTTVEIKSGYGLDVESELKMLRVIQRLGSDFPVTVIPTFLGAHTLPPEYYGRPDDYIRLVVDEMLPAIAAEDLAVAVDAFCERIGFSTVQVERIFRAAAAHGFQVKLHAEQLSDQKGTLLAVRHKALSVDHLEYLQAEDVAVLSDRSTVAVLLPGAFYFLKETQKPPVAQLRNVGVPMAVATDCNPGSSPCTSPLLMMNMACVLFGLTPTEALEGMTVNAARALDLQDQVGCLAVGKQADFVVWDIAEPTELSYSMGHNPLRMIVKAGELISL